jgi:YidC/Oxa1 family membrane protein insertase
MLLTANIFQPLIDVFEAIIKFFHNSLGVPWGWAIVLLTVAVRAALIPLTVKQIKSMARMQALAPEMKALQAKYKEDKQRQSQEMMKFYKENNVNPFGSCLPLVAQLPVFISLYFMLRQSLRVDICPAWQRANNHGVLSTAHTVACGSHGQSSFLFIGDITNSAHGATLVILIILYVGTQLMSTLMMSAAAMEPTQRYMMMALPLFFVLFVIRFPAGVLVYWITTNTWTMGQQYIVKRRLGPMRAAAAAASGDSAGGGTSPPAADRKPTGGSGGSSSRASTPRSAKASDNGAAPSGGLSGLMRRARGESDEPVATSSRPAGPPPQSPRKKKKRSGRRR